MTEIIGLDGKKAASVPTGELVDTEGNLKIIMNQPVTFLFMSGFGVEEPYEKLEDAQARVAELCEILCKPKSEVPMFIKVNGEPIQVEMLQNVMIGKPSPLSRG